MGADMRGGGYPTDTVDINVDELYIEEAQKLKKLYTNEFKSSYKDLVKLLESLKKDKSFQGKAKTGYTEVLEILLEFQKDIIDAMDGYYDKFDELHEELQGIKKVAYYKGVQK